MTELKCPECGSTKLRKNGFTWRRKLIDGKRVGVKLQKWQCNECGLITGRLAEINNQEVTK